MKTVASSIALGLSLVSLILFACSDDDPPAGPPPATSTARGSEATGQTCRTAAECYPTMEAGALKGEPYCLDRVTNGYCTHLCATDQDCCAVPGECRTGIKQVCAPFESVNKRMCFLSCEKGDLKPGPDGGAVLDESGYCQAYAGAAFECRATGGGDPRKVCFPKD